MKRLVSLFFILVSGITLFAAEVSQQEAMEKARWKIQNRASAGARRLWQL